MNVCWFHRAKGFACAFVVLACAMSQAHAEPTVAAQLAHEIRGGIERAEIGISFPTALAGQFGSTPWIAMVNVDIARWHATAHEHARSHIDDVGLTPQLRVLPQKRGSFEPFVDVGVGVHVLSAHELGDLQLGTRFQFGEYLGVGAVLGERRRLTLALRLSHESNCGVSRSNSGLTAVGLRLEYALR